MCNHISYPKWPQMVKLGRLVPDFICWMITALLCCVFCSLPVHRQPGRSQKRECTKPANYSHSRCLDTLHHKQGLLPEHRRDRAEQPATALDVTAA
jgi:hypothetical protein